MNPFETTRTNDVSTLVEYVQDDALTQPEFIVDKSEPVLVTGANGFIGSRVAKGLLEQGFKHVRCFARSSKGGSRLEALARLEYRLQDGDLHWKSSVATGLRSRSEECKSYISSCGGPR